MERRMGRLGGVVCAMAAAVTLVSMPLAYAQTQGMERRDERRDDRAGARAAKQACKAGDEKTRAECRHVKRSTKQATRGTNHKASTAPPAQPTP